MIPVRHPARFLLFAPFHPVLEAIQSGIEISKIYLRKGISGHNISLIRKAGSVSNIPIRIVPPEKFSTWKIPPSQGVIAEISPIRFSRLDHVIQSIYENGVSPLLILLDGVTDVRNFGSIGRSAVCAGAHGIIVKSTHSAPINKDALKASAGALFKIPICRTLKPQQIINELKLHGIFVLALTEKSSTDIYEIDFNVPICIVLGDEGKGISPEVLKLCSATSRIPMPGRFSSLNVSNAAAVALFEAVRQRIKLPG